MRRVAGTIARRGASAVGRAALRAADSEKHTLAALGTAAALGIARRKGYELPTIGGMPAALTVGLGAWAFGKFSKNRVAQHIATGALSVAVYDLVAYTRDTREGIDTLVEAQVQAEEDEEDETSGPARARRILNR